MFSMGLAHSGSAVESNYFCPLPTRSSSCTSSPVYSAASPSAGSGCWVLPLSTALLYSSFIGRVWGRACSHAAHSRLPQLIYEMKFFTARPLPALLLCAPKACSHHYGPPLCVTFLGVRGGGEPWKGWEDRDVWREGDRKSVV